MKKQAKVKEQQTRCLVEVAKKEDPDAVELCELRRYIAGQTPRSVAAFANLKKICEEHLQGRYNIEVVDLVKHPQLAEGGQLLSIPTPGRRLPQPLREIG